MATTGHSFSLARMSSVPAPLAGSRMMRAVAGTSTPIIAPISRHDRPTTFLFRWPPGNTRSRNFWTIASSSVNHTLPVAWNETTISL